MRTSPLIDPILINIKLQKDHEHRKTLVSEGFGRFDFKPDLKAIKGATKEGSFEHEGLLLVRAER